MQDVDLEGRQQRINEAAVFLIVLADQLAAAIKLPGPDDPRLRNVLGRIVEVIKLIDEGGPDYSSDLEKQIRSKIKHIERQILFLNQEYQTGRS